jgi:hypothetical protein
LILNGDLDFEDAGELVWSKAPSKTTPASGSFTSSATTGSTRMRMKSSRRNTFLL